MNRRETEPSPVEGVPDYWTRVREADHRLLALDYDGTLAPFRVDRMKARPLTGVIEVLTVLNEMPGLDLAVFTGRPCGEISILLGDLRITVVGSHGFETLRPDGRLAKRVIPPKQEDGLLRAETAAVQAGLVTHLERKHASIALHTRGLSAHDAGQAQETAKRLWTPIASEADMNLRPFQGGVEIRAADHDKGTALAEYCATLEPGTFVTYVGDDDTDEDAFRWVQSAGVGIKVGGDRRSTAARGWLRDCDNVLEFLRGWVMVMPSGR